jgi:hypothetical protein
MSLEALEQTVRNRIRAFLRYSRTVTILGTIALGALIWAAVHVTLARRRRSALPLARLAAPTSNSWRC